MKGLAFLLGPHDLHFDGAFGLSEGIGDFLDLEIVLVFHHQDCFVARWDFIKHDRQTVVFHFQEDAVRDFHFGFLADFADVFRKNQLYLFLFPDDVNAKVVGNRIDPCGKRGLLAELAEVQEDFDENVLRSVAGHALIAQETDAFGENFSGVPAVQEREKVGVLAPQVFRDEFGIG